MKVLHSAFISILYGTIVKLYLQGNTEVLGENSAPVPLCPPQILYKDRPGIEGEPQL